MLLGCEPLREEKLVEQSCNFITKSADDKNQVADAKLKSTESFLKER